MRLGASLFLIAAGAILKWAVTDHVKQVNLGVVGIVLMVVGVVGLLAEILYQGSRRRTTVLHAAAPVVERPVVQRPVVERPVVEQPVVDRRY